MNKSVFGILVLLFASSCNIQQPDFARMSDQELFEYNSSVGILDQVFCRDEIRIGSHIRTRYCARYGETFSGHIKALSTPSSSSSVTYAK